MQPDGKPSLLSVLRDYETFSFFFWLALEKGIPCFT